MTYYADLTPYAYGDADTDTLHYDWGYVRYHPEYERRNVGWLSAEHPFERGPVPDWFAGALLDVIGNPSVNRYRGLHTCEFCPPGEGRAILDPRPREGFIVINGVEEPLGPEYLAYHEIRVPAGPGVMFAAPALVWHYVAAHEYRPPVEFVEAVRRYDADWATQPGSWIPANAERLVYGGPRPTWPPQSRTSRPGSYQRSQRPLRHM